MKKASLRGLIKNLIWSMEGSELPCIPCEIANSRRPDRAHKGHMATRRGEVFFVDILAVSIPTFWGGNYGCCFIDSATRLAIPDIVARKSHVDESLDNLINFCAAHGVEIGLIQTDDEVVFAGKDCRFRGRAKKAAIPLQQSPPYSHWANGVVERFILTLLRKSFALIAQSGASNQLWGAAMIHAAHLYNMMPHAALDGDSPYMRWFGTKTAGRTVAENLGL